MTLSRTLFDALSSNGLQTWTDDLAIKLDAAYRYGRHGDLPRWQAVLAALPNITPGFLDFNSDVVTIGGETDCPPAQRDEIEQHLRELHPWRKGPYRVYGIDIDTEWRSDFKWRRLCGHIQPLAGRRVLDVGCGSGYHGWRMLGAGARLVIGIDPTWLSVMQFRAIKHFAGVAPLFVLPLGIEDMPQELHAFDTVFSMGVFHHRRSPLDHLFELRGLLRKRGELVLETLVIEGPEGQVLLPENRYAQMRNVWFIPTPATLLAWLQRCGYRNVRLIDVSVTTSDEQRSTDWMRFQSLADFLDPTDPSRTCEGYPAPRRAIFLAESP